MKIKLIFCLLATIQWATAAENTLPNTREIIGSGIFDVNSTRTFNIDENSLIYLDGTEIDYTLFEIIGSGFKTSFTLNTDTNPEVTRGTVNAIDLTTNIKGPITSLSPLMVLEQPVLITSNTIKAIGPELKLSQLIAVSGYLSANNSLKATRVMDTIGEWKIRGFAELAQNNQLSIGNLSIIRTNEVLINCPNNVNNGDLIEVIMTEDVNYLVGSSITTIQSIECLTRNLLGDTDKTLPSVMQGFISQNQGQNFWIDDIKINVNNSTIYLNGEKNFIDNFVNVEIQGVFDSQTSELQAHVVRFLDHRIEIVFPLYPENISANESIQLHGLTLIKTPQTIDTGQILSGTVDGPIQVKIQGFVDSNGTAYLSKTQNTGAVNLNNVSLRGNVSALNNPFFTLLGFDIDSSTSTIVSQGNGTIDTDTFFDLISENSQVEIKNAVFDEELNQIRSGLIKINRLDSDTDKISNNTNNREIIGSGVFGAFGVATITATPDQLFVSDFE